MTDFSKTVLADILIDDEGQAYRVVSVHDLLVDLADMDGHYAFSLTLKELADEDYTLVHPA